MGVDLKYFSNFVIAKRGIGCPCRSVDRQGGFMLLFVSMLEKYYSHLYILEQDEKDICDAVHVYSSRRYDERRERSACW